MFPIHVQLTVSTPADLAKLNDFVAQFYAHGAATAPRLPQIVDPALAQHVNTLSAAVIAEEKAEVLDAPKPSPAPRARTPRTAEAPVAAAPAPTAPAQESSAAAHAGAAPPASTAATEEFKYETLQKAVLGAASKHSRDALLAIARKHGAESFKALPASAWAAAHADVVALG